MATRNCPSCNEIIQAEASLCRFCKEPVKPKTNWWKVLFREWGTNPWSWKRFILRWVILLIIFVGFPGYLIGPYIVMSLRQERMTQCANNLSQLWKMQYNYSVRYGGTNKLFPEETGERFWLRLSDREIRLIDNSSPKIFECPVEGSANRGDTDYRGPSYNVNKYKDGEPVGADKVGNHGDDGSEGGNVLRRSGDVQTVGHDDQLWNTAAKLTMP